MKRFTFGDDDRHMYPNIEFKEKDLENELIGQHKFYKESKLVNSDFIDLVITNRSGLVWKLMSGS